MSSDEFFDIADALVTDEANEYLDKRLKLVEKWAQVRQARGERADLRTLIDQLMHEPNERGPVIVTLAAALWRLREMEKADAGSD